MQIYWGIIPRKNSIEFLIKSPIIYNINKQFSTSRVKSMNKVHTFSDLLENLIKFTI